jgi:cobalt-zinc-cadmium resistance protein CzcA
MGREFIPSLDEGDVLVQPVRVAGTSVTQSAEMSSVI